MNSLWHRISSSEYHVLKEDPVKNIFSSLSPAERVVFVLLSVVFAASALMLLARANRAVMVEIPSSGGTLTEGVIGTPRFINPLLAISDADRDLSSLVYSGLFKVNDSGDLVPDLAESYSISDDGLTYTVKIQDTAVFQDGTRVTAEDVIYTVGLAEDATLKSPRRANWDGVNVGKVDADTVTFTLKQPYAPFLENLTMGILPAHLWKSVTPAEFAFSELNVEPIGSGPYEIAGIVRNSSGIPTSYTLRPFRKSVGGIPYIGSIVFRFYEDEAAQIHAYDIGEVDAIGGLSPDNLPAVTRVGGTVTRSPLPRVFGIFLNQNQNPIFADSNVRAALDTAVDKEKIVESVLHGYGTPIESPFPPGTLSGVTLPTKPHGDKVAALALLAKAGWVPDSGTGKLMKGKGAKAVQMKFAIATPNTPELKAAAESAAKDFTDLGIDATVKVFEPGDLSQNIIRPRDYEALFFGEVVGREYDLFAFWHSSQRIDPGLNIALYANITGDKLLESARAAENESDRTASYLKFDALFRQEHPAILVYAPEYIYLIPEKLKGRHGGTITTPSDRFNNIREWYISTEWVWPIFEKANLRKYLPF